jgi:hypothetical protein
MSNLPPENPNDQPPLDFFPPAEDNAEKLVRLAVIFNYISVGLDVLTLLLLVVVGLVCFLAPDAVREQNPGGLPPALMGGIYLGLSPVTIVLGVIKAIGTRKLQTAATGAWGWGLTAGIIGCCQLFCASCCCLQVAAGVYSIVILSFQNVRQYVAFRQEQKAASDMGGPPGEVGEPPMTPPSGF